MIFKFLYLRVPQQEQLVQVLELVDFKVVVHVAQHSYVGLHLPESGPENVLGEVDHVVRRVQLVVVSRGLADLHGQQELEGKGNRGSFKLFA